MYHGTKTDKAKRLDSDETVPQQKGKSAMVLEISPIIHAKFCSLSGIECFSDFAVIIYHHVMKVSHGCNGADLIFDFYFDAKAGTRNDRGKGSMLVS